MLFFLPLNRHISGFVLYTFFLLAFSACSSSKKEAAYTKSKQGYWYQLFAFRSEKTVNKNVKAKKISALFLTQKDSVFYDSEHDLNDNFLILADTSGAASIMKRAMSLAIEGDSMSLLIPAGIFFRQQFSSAVPSFCKNDSVVKINFIVVKDLDVLEYKSESESLYEKERKQILAYFKSEKRMSEAKDPLGFYWLEKKFMEQTDSIKAGMEIEVSYSGGFLNGRMIDYSPSQFRFIYGTPDQLIQGLNYVIARSKKGQTSKIILPSQLAFGETGSSNGSVAPFTPMLYSISIN